MTNSITLELPALYGDHHVIEVRRILLGLPGVMDVYVSSAFRSAEITYDPEKINAQEIARPLEQAGYLDDLAVPVETGSANGNGKASFMRQTTTYEQTRSSITFGQHVSYLGRPLWNCPGLGLVRKMEE